jgi:hypothetical protein
MRPSELMCRIVPSLGPMLRSRCYEAGLGASTAEGYGAALLSLVVRGLGRHPVAARMRRGARTPRTFEWHGPAARRIPSSRQAQDAALSHRSRARTRRSPFCFSRAKDSNTPPPCSGSGRVEIAQCHRGRCSHLVDARSESRLEPTTLSKAVQFDPVLRRRHHHSRHARPMAVTGTTWAREHVGVALSIAGVAAIGPVARSGKQTGRPSSRRR